MRELAADVRPSGPPIPGTMLRAGKTVRILRCPGANGAACVAEGAWLKGRDVCTLCVERATVWDGPVPVERARQHLLDLSARGIGYKAVSAASDVAPTVLCRILANEGTIRASTERRVLAVDDGAIADHAVVDGSRTREILADLRARGFTLAHIGSLVGVDARQVCSQAKRDRTLAASVHTYEKLMRRVESGEVAPERFHVAAHEERGFVLDLLRRGVPPTFLTRRLGFYVQRSMLERARRMHPKNVAAVRAFRAELEEMRREGTGRPEGWETESAGAIGAIAAAFGFANDGGNRGWSSGGLSRGEPAPKKRRRRRRKLSVEEQRAHNARKARERRAAMTLEERRAEWRRHQQTKRARDRAAREAQDVYAEAAE